VRDAAGVSTEHSLASTILVIDAALEVDYRPSRVVNRTWVGL
jgi:hypothetical protein